VCGALSAPVEAQLTRSQAVLALLDPGSGVALDATTTVGWSPFVDFGFGAGFEGLVPTGTTMTPYEVGSLPFPGPGIIAFNNSYVFFLDDEPGAHFQHPTRYVLVNAGISMPTVFNGGIVVSSEGWWPIVTPPGGQPLSIFDTLLVRTSSSPASPTNPDGLIFGSAPDPADLDSSDDLDSSGDQGHFEREDTAGANACGLIAIGPTGSTDPNYDFSGNVAIWESDLKNHYNVPNARIKKANGGSAASKQDLCDAIDAIVAMSPPCDKIYVRISSHGSMGSLTLSDGKITAMELCEKFKKLAGLGVPICMVINACHSGSLLDANNWNFPAGSSIITSAASDKSSWGGAFTPAGGTGCFNASLYVKAHSECLNDTTDTNGDGKFDADTNMDGIVGDVEAHNWVVAQKPCYTWKGNMKNYYPAGPPTGTPGGNPTPGVTTIGQDPRRININVCNGTGAEKTDFHMIFQGDVTGGAAGAWESTIADVIGAPWANGTGETTVTYNRETNETMVCWMDRDTSVAAGSYIHFGYSRSKGGLRPLRQYWTPTATPTSDADKTAMIEGSSKSDEDGSNVIVRFVTRSKEAGGWGGLVTAKITFRASPKDIPLANLNLGDPVVQSMPIIGIALPFDLEPDQPVEIHLPVPFQIEATDYLIAQINTSWLLNGTQTSQLMIFNPVDTGPWDDLGNGLAGTLGKPELTAIGPLTTQSFNQLELTNTLPSSAAHLVISLEQLNLPFKGGVLVPAPDFIVFGLPVDDTGNLIVPFVWPTTLPGGLSLYTQFWINDPDSHGGFAASNGLQGG
jgi:hypothetical protein